VFVGGVRSRCPCSGVWLSAFCRVLAAFVETVIVICRRQVNDDDSLLSVIFS